MHSQLVHFSSARSEIRMLCLYYEIMGKPATRSRPWGIPPGSRLETARIQEKLSLMAFPCPHGQGGTLQLRETEKGGGL